jgi:KaiC/GvpD/RAD55 family RecA-like ATPase
MTKTLSTGISGLDIVLNGGYPKASLMGSFGFYGDLEIGFILAFLREGIRTNENVLYVSAIDSEFVFWQKSNQWGIKPESNFHLYKIPDTSLGTLPKTIREITKIIDDNHITRIGIDLTPLLPLNDLNSLFVSIGRLKDLIWRHNIVGLLAITKGTTEPEVRVGIQSILDGIIDILPSNLPVKCDALFKITKMKNSNPMKDYLGFKITNGEIIIDQNENELISFEEEGEEENNLIKEISVDEYIFEEE